MRCHGCSELLPPDDGTGRCPHCRAYRPAPQPAAAPPWVPLGLAAVGAAVGYLASEWKGFAIGAVAGWPLGLLAAVVRDEFREESPPAVKS